MELSEREKKLAVLYVSTIIALCVGFYLIYPKAPPEDTTPPAQVTGLTVTDAYDGKLDLSWNSCTDPDFDHYNIYRNGQKITEGIDNNYRDTDLTNGQSYNYQVSAVDNSGNKGQKSNTVSGTPTAADTTPPTVSNLQPAENSTTSDDTPTIGASYNDPSGIDITSVKISVDNTDVTASATVTSTSATYTPAVALAEGHHTVEVRASDNYGNEATRTWSFTVDLEEKWALLLGSANDFPPNTTIEKVKENDNVPNWSFEYWATDSDPFCWDNQTLIPTIHWWSATDAHTLERSALMELENGAEGFWYIESEYRISVTPNVQYTVTAYTKMHYFDNANPPIAHVGILWYDSTGSPIGTTIWSSGVSAVAAWTPVTLTTTSPSNAASAEIRLKGKNPSPSDMCWVLFDTVSMWHYEYESNSSTLPDKDGFPAQALQAYYVLRGQGYDDAHITLMLYHKNDPFIDIEGDGVNDLTNATIDFEDDAVTRARFITEIQNLAAAADANDEVLIYMVNHGDNFGDTAYFFFEVGAENIREDEMAPLLNGFVCEEITVLIDSCYSGNFISSLTGANRILIAAAGDDNLAKYWVEANPSENIPYAGSWFFHPFWERIDAGDSVQAAYNYACAVVPTQIGPYAGKTVAQIQNPEILYHVGD